MAKSQFNVKISSELLTQLKSQAMRSGKTLTDHVTELIEMSLKREELDVFNQLPVERIEKIENRLSSMETAISNLEQLILNSTQFKNR